ncbi:galactose mutarotase [Polaribacter reichenbachii]|uniref:Aldose 1-epimerase n=1 Tax=Polaribacter reichenbachii TaxID=996801 RepID=A0A1B8TV89_9FLAO|nr:aldose epimerase family protein [Polaribacter reichenbachii]APZ45510.1 galactose mutarotase [Polaribacter reichenbachii]AUC19371.1 galactose mutarotase [Polaribacter reichenbachii]OBY63474.1 galactose mutarotase [Polaribacter reichenbachii]
MQIETTDFGSCQGIKVKEYSLKNENGVEVKITNYGATITTIKVPDSKGNIQNIACGFDALQSYFDKTYLENSPYFGGTIGRYCSQIKDSKFTLNGKEYQLAKNCGENNLHGGVTGFDKKFWRADVIENGVKMSFFSKDLEEGFPGNVEVLVTFTLNNNNELKIDYSATPDQDTPLSLTNHTYFNLNAFSSTVESFTAKVNTDKRHVIDETGAATGEIANIAGEADDLTKGKIIGDVHEALGDGFEHFYVFDNPDFKLQEVAQITSAESGRSLTVLSTEPCMLLYTGKYTSDEIKRENGEQYGKYRGFCCETHRYQNGPNIENSPKSITKAGEEFKSTTIFKFGW